MDKIYNDYDNFAYFYNKYWTINAPFYLKKALDIIMLANMREKASILDVCCGTGHIVKLLKESGYNVSGLDGSSLMLDYAKENVPSADFIQADIRDFNLNKKFNAITCLFDSINHLLKEEDVLNAFTNIYNHLEKDGIFAFDTNSLDSSIDAGISDFSAIEENEVFICKGSFENIEKIIVYNLSWFIKENSFWQRFDYVIKEQYYSENTLISLLKKAGFTNIAFCYGEDLGIDVFADRIFWTARK